MENSYQKSIGKQKELVYNSPVSVNQVQITIGKGVNVCLKLF